MAENFTLGLVGGVLGRSLLYYFESSLFVQVEVGELKYHYIKLYILIGLNFVHYIIKCMTKGREMLAGSNSSGRVVAKY